MGWVNIFDGRHTVASQSNLCARAMLQERMCTLSRAAETFLSKSPGCVSAQFALVCACLYNLKVLGLLKDKHTSRMQAI